MKSKSTILTFPFYEIKAPALKMMLGVEDNRSVVSKLMNMGVRIRSKGKDKYIITEDVLEALKDNEGHTGYVAKSKLSEI